MQIVILDADALNPGDISFSSLEKLGKLTAYNRTKKEEIIERAKDAEIVLTNKTPLREQTLSQLPKLRYIGVLATGYNVIDVDAAKKRGIVVTNIPSYGTEIVAQYTIALLLELCHHVYEHAQYVKEGGWTNSGAWCHWLYPLIELKDKTLGIIGMGNIGIQTSKIALAMGMKVITSSKNIRPELEELGISFVSMDTLLQTSDVISLHCPLTETTRRMINRETIGKMKQGAILLNTARGPLIDEQALMEALNSGKLAGAACDVTAKEPIPADSPLLKAKNILITPHIAWAAQSTRQRLVDMAAENLQAFLAGNPIHTV